MNINVESDAMLKINNDSIYATKFYAMQKQIDELQQENKQLKEVIDKARECIKNFLHSEAYINSDGDAITNNYYEDTLDILNEVSK